MTLRVRNWDKLYETHRTRELKRLDFVLIPTSMDTDGYTTLLDHPNGAAHLGAWIALLQIAARCKERGTLANSEGRPHTAKSLSRISRIPVKVFEELIPRLLSEEIQWLEDTSRDPAQIPRDVAEQRDDAREQRDDAREQRDDAREGAAGIVMFSSVQLLEKGGCGGKKPIEAVPARERLFEEFWQAYWRKSNKAEAKKSWNKHYETEDHGRSIIAAAVAQSPYYLAREPDKRPWASTWLNQKRYEDPIEDDPSKSVSISPATVKAAQMFLETG